MTSKAGPSRQNTPPPAGQRKTSMYSRQMVVMIGLIALCLAMLGAGFMALTYRYHQEASRETLERNVATISRYANAAFSEGMTLSSTQFRSYITSVAMISNSTILLCDPQGQILYAAGTNLPEDDALLGARVPTWAVNELLTDMTYSGTTTFNGLLATESFVTGVPIVTYKVDAHTGETINNGSAIGILFLAADASSLLNFMQNIFQLFLITAGAVMLLSLVICSVAVQRITEPLKGMSRAAHKFAHGEVDTRFTEYAHRTDEIGELAVAFNAMADSLAQAEKKRSEFVANVSHELKTPMTTIAGFAEGILDGTIPPEKEKESLQVISSETRRLSRLVRRMLELSRLQSSERVAAQEQFDVAEVLLQVLVSLEGKITEKDLDVQVDLPDGPVMVWGDPDAVTQVCYNLLDNAAKFAVPKGKLTLGIATRGGKAYISVGNEGETIPPDQLAHIFDRFHKADGSRSAHKEGVGLGLYIVKTLLNTYKEDISVTSEDGFTRFTFTLSEV
ncbi:MAG: HAMP domain-containing sensor histidine kinase [Bacillota bacterium]|nr:HAMP domain-containing sensor histidine kinase [Bacillota bacterium]